jgi:hypothetical protein
MHFLLKSSIHTVKRRSVSITVTHLFLADACKPQKADATLPFSFISLAIFIIARTVDSGSLTALPILELL